MDGTWTEEPDKEQIERSTKTCRPLREIGVKVPISHSVPMASTVARYLVSDPRFFSLTCVWCSTEWAFVNTLRSPMIKPLLLELYWRFRCHGREKLGSVCTQNTLTTASIDGTTRATCSHLRDCCSATTSWSPLSPPLLTTTREFRSGDDGLLADSPRLAFCLLPPSLPSFCPSPAGSWPSASATGFLGRPRSLRGLEAPASASSMGGPSEGEGAPVWPSTALAVGALPRPLFLLASILLCSLWSTNLGFPTPPLSTLRRPRGRWAGEKKGAPCSRRVCRRSRVAEAVDEQLKTDSYRVGYCHPCPLVGSTTWRVDQQCNPKEGAKWTVEIDPSRCGLHSVTRRKGWWGRWWKESKGRILLLIY